MKLAALAPPIVGLSFDHWAPQKSTVAPTTFSLSPIVNAPPPGAKAKTSTFEQVALVELPPSSSIIVFTSKNPVVV